jgi:hypothetical protein
LPESLERVHSAKKRKKKIEKKIMKKIEKIFNIKQSEDGRSFGTYKYQRKIFQFYYKDSNQQPQNNRYISHEK